MTAADEQRAHIQALLEKLHSLNVAMSLIRLSRDELVGEILTLSVVSNNASLNSAGRMIVQVGKDIPADQGTINDIRERLKEYLEIL